MVCFLEIAIHFAVSLQLMLPDPDSDAVWFCATSATPVRTKLHLGFQVETWSYLRHRIFRIQNSTHPDQTADRNYENLFHQGRPYRETVHGILITVSLEDAHVGETSCVA